MSFLPIVGRELRVASRKRGTYWSRMGSALAAIAIGAWIMTFSQTGAPQMLGKILFSTLAVVTLFFAAQAGIRVTSDCLSEEKREGTLGLLFLTDLKGYDVVFGKLVSNSLGAFYGILATFPVLAIALLLGGVTYGEFGRIALVALNILFLSLSIGMFSSAVCRDERRAIGMAVVIAVALAGLFPAIGGLIAAKTHAPYNTAFVTVSPVYGCVLAFDPMYKLKPDSFWVCSAITHLYSWLFLAMACVIVPRSWQDKSSSGKTLKIKQTIAELTEGKGDERKRFRGHLLDINPFYWRVARDRMKPRIAWIILAIFGAAWLWGWTELRRDWLNAGVYIATAIVLHTVFKFQFAFESCRYFLEDRRSGAMELMLSTPLKVDEILRGQRLAILRQFGGPVLVVLLLDFIFLIACLKEDRWSDLSLWLSLWLAGSIIFVMDLNALSWLGMWLGLSGQKTNRAAGAAAARILFLPWMGLGLTASVIAFLSIMGAFRQLFANVNFPDNTPIIYWFALSVANNILWMKWSQSRLRTRFRDLATQKFDAPRSWLARFWPVRQTKSPPVIVAR